MEPLASTTWPDAATFAGGADWTGGVRLGAADGPVILLATRDHVKDSLLS